MFVLTLSGLKRVSTSELGKTEDFTKEVLHRPLTIKRLSQAEEGDTRPPPKGRETFWRTRGRASVNRVWWGWCADTVRMRSRGGGG